MGREENVPMLVIGPLASEITMHVGAIETKLQLYICLIEKRLCLREDIAAILRRSVRGGYTLTTHVLRRAQG